MTYLGLIDFKLDLYIKVNVNTGQNKFEVHISKHLAKMAINWHKTVMDRIQGETDGVIIYASMLRGRLRKFCDTKRHQ